MKAVRNGKRFRQMMSNTQRQFADTSAEAVSSSLRFSPWAVWHSYDVHRLGKEDAYVVAAPVPKEERRKWWDLSKWWDLYSPLKDTPGLFLEFAELADRQIDEDVWRYWFTRYGVLGLRPGPTPYLAEARGGPEETLSGFIREAEIANGVLRLWEAATAGMSDEKFVERYFSHFERLQDRAKNIFVWYVDFPRRTTPPWLSLVGMHVQNRLTTECYPQLVGTSSVAFDTAYGFRSLLGAMYLQMYWLMTAKGDVRRCKKPGCPRVITFDQPEQPRDHWIPNDRSRGYKTRVDKVFCSPACKQRDYDRRKRMSQA